MMRRFAAVAIGGWMLAVAGCSPSAPTVDPAEAERGHAAFERRDFEAAYSILAPIAQHGDADAQFKVGYMYLHGRGVDRDFDSALRWLTLAADQGHAEAQYNLALNYEGGRGVAQDVVEAHKWASLAASQGYRAAGELRDDTAARMTEDEMRQARKRISEWRVRR